MTHALGAEPDLATIGRLEQAQEIEQGGLAGTRRAGDGHELAALQLEIDPVQDGHGAPPGPA